MVAVVDFPPEGELGFREMRRVLECGIQTSLRDSWPLLHAYMHQNRTRRERRCEQAYLLSCGGHRIYRNSWDLGVTEKFVQANVLNPKFGPWV